MKKADLFMNSSTTIKPNKGKYKIPNEDFALLISQISRGNLGKSNQENVRFNFRQISYFSSLLVGLSFNLYYILSIIY